MTNVVLPKLNQVGANEFADVEDNDVAIREVINGQIDNANLSGAAGITRANLATAAKPVLWYTPTIIATEETRTNTSYGTMTTPDEVKEVVLPTNALLVVTYMALMKGSANTESATSIADAAIFLSATQLKGNAVTAPAVQAASISDSPRDTTNKFQFLRTVAATTSAEGLAVTSEETAFGAFVTTGMVAPSPTQIFAAPGTYNVNVRFKAPSGTVTVKERKLWVGVLGATT